MKKIRILLSTVIVLAALAVPVTQIACSSVERTTYQAVGTAQVSVDTAMAAWNAHVGAGRASVTQEMQVKGAYEKYQLAALFLIDTAKSAGSTNSPALNQVVASAATSLANLVGLIRSFGAKL